MSCINCTVYISTVELSNSMVSVPTRDFDDILRFENIKLRVCVCCKIIKVREMQNVLTLNETY